MTTTKYTIELPYTCDFLLKRSLQKAMKQYWKESLIMAKSPLIRHETDDIYWQENIDITADMILQIMKQDKNS